MASTGRGHGKTPFNEALRAVASFIKQVNRPAAVIGGVAVIAHGFPRTTLDIDVAVRALPGDLDDLLKSASRVGLQPRIPNAVEFAQTNLVLLLEHKKTRVTQLSLSFRFPPSEVFEGLGERNRWCRSLEEFPQFSAFVEGHPALRAVEGVPPVGEGELSFFQP